MGLVCDLHAAMLDLTSDLQQQREPNGDRVKVVTTALQSSIIGRSVGGEDELMLSEDDVLAEWTRHYVRLSPRPDAGDELTAAHAAHRAFCAKVKDNDALADIWRPESRQSRRPVTEDRHVAQPASGKRESRRKGVKAVLPIEDNGSFASLLNAYDQPTTAPERNVKATKKWSTCQPESAKLHVHFGRESYRLALSRAGEVQQDGSRGEAQG
jgi:hypothetical protein